MGVIEWEVVTDHINVTIYHIIVTTVHINVYRMLFVTCTFDDTTMIYTFKS